MTGGGDVRGAAVRTALERLGRRRQLRTGSRLCEQGNAVARVTLILGGHAKVVACDADGRETLLAILGPGEVVGELAAIDREPHSATVVALAEMDVVETPAGEFIALLARDPAVTLDLLRVVSGKLRRADGLRTEFGALDTTGRVCRRLLEMASAHGVVTAGGVEISVPLTQDELAAWTGSSREAVARSLRALREIRAVRTSRRRLVITDVAVLRRRAE